ncbi:MAG: response regulator transcription factor, partial [Leptolyngbyaceae cyanobacterium SU_3_3]|nr:response regulator transcription factor [Leptolyngbyaceae cyanobacterium SU_3_3]
MIELERSSLRPIAELAEPELGLAGVRINPKLNTPARYHPAFSLRVKPLLGGVPELISLPPHAGIGYLHWSPDSRYLAFNQARQLPANAPETETYLDTTVFLLDRERPKQAPRALFGPLVNKSLQLDRLDVGEIIFAKFTHRANGSKDDAPAEGRLSNREREVVQLLCEGLSNKEVGAKLGVTSAFLYPITVTVSAITSVLTPFLIRAADHVIALHDRLAPTSLLNYQHDYHQWVQRVWHARAPTSAGASSAPRCSNWASTSHSSPASSAWPCCC